MLESCNRVHAWLCLLHRSGLCFRFAAPGLVCDVWVGLPQLNSELLVYIKLHREPVS